MRLLTVLLPLLALGPAFAALEARAEIPLPKPRPAPVGAAPAEQPVEYPEVAAGPSPCEQRLAALAAFAPLPVLIGPGACGARDVVRLDAVTMPDRTRVTLDQPAVLRCSMAEAVANWVREDIGPAAGGLGSPLAALGAYESYECRGRNRVAGAKVSEHGKANAIDIVGVRLADGRRFDWFDTAVPRDFRERIKASACTRFKTVLGPGSDGHHEDHIHVDLAERRSGYRICNWEVRDPAPVAAVPAHRVPLPPQRPAR